MSVGSTPVRLDLKRDEKLEVQWQDGRTSVYPLAYLRAKCPCATCRTERQREEKATRPLLRVLKGDQSRPLKVVDVERVGNYAIRLEWSDNHSTGIYSFEYLREIDPEKGT